MDLTEEKIINKLIGNIDELIEHREVYDEYESIDHFAMVFLDGLINYLSDNANSTQNRELTKFKLLTME